MKRSWIEYSKEWRQSPMSFWVHRATDGKAWHQAKEFNPAMPRPVAGLGYPYFFVECDGFIFEFASLDEIDACVARLSQRHLPDTEQEAKGMSGPGAFWQNKLPKSVLSWRYREKAVKYLRQCRELFTRSLTAESQSP
jgi:hypothetical protein